MRLRSDKPIRQETDIGTDLLGQIHYLVQTPLNNWKEKSRHEGISKNVRPTHSTHCWEYCTWAKCCHHAAHHIGYSPNLVDSNPTHKVLPSTPSNTESFAKIPASEKKCPTNKNLGNTWDKICDFQLLKKNTLFGCLPLHHGHASWHT
jgi:hypothetical protein